MKITLLTTNQHGIWAQSFMLFKRHGYRVEEKQQSLVNSEQTLYTFILSNDGNHDILRDDLIQIKGVLEVNFVAKPKETDTLADKKRLLEIAQNLIEQYPDFVEVVQKLYQNPQLSTQDLFDIGQYVGEGIIEKRKIKPVSPKNIAVAVKKIIVPAFEPFSIAEAYHNLLRLHANPFCLDLEPRDEPRCYFIKGMIQGLLQSANNLPQINVEEINCKALGADSCVFRIS